MRWAAFIERADGPLPTSRKESRRLLELVALLAAQGENPVSLNQLADALWPDADGDAARNSLDNALHRLRKLLGGDDRVVLRQGTLALNPQRCWTDVAVLDRHLTALDQSPGRGGAGAHKGLMPTVPGAPAPDRHWPVWRQPA